MISGYLVGDREMIARFQGAFGVIKRDLDATVQRMTFAVKATTQRDWLRGPRPERLAVKTGRLINSVATRFEFTPTASYGYVGTNVGYGIAWERSFERRTGAGARGGLFWGMSPGTLGAYFGKHPPGVKHYQRPFLAPALQQMRGTIIHELTATLTASAAKALK